MSDPQNCWQGDPTPSYSMPFDEVPVSYIKNRFRRCFWPCDWPSMEVVPWEQHPQKWSRRPSKIAHTLTQTKWPGRSVTRMRTVTIRWYSFCPRNRRSSGSWQCLTLHHISAERTVYPKLDILESTSRYLRVSRGQGR